MLEKSKLSYNDGILKITLKEEDAVDLLSNFEHLVEQYPSVSHIEFEMHEINIIFSKFLATLASIKKISVKKQFSIVLLNVNSQTMQLFDAVDISQLFTFKDDFSVFSLNDLIQKLSDQTIASEISSYLASSYSNEIREKLINIINSDCDTTLAEYAIITMGKAQDTESLDIFRKELNNKNYNIVRSAILVLGWIGDIQSKSELYKFLSTGNTEVAEAAAASIALLSDDKDSSKLEEFINDDNYLVRKIAAQALSLINDEESYNILVKRLSIENEESVRVAIVKRLSLYRKEEVMDILVSLLDDTSINIREASASGIVRIGANSKSLDKIVSKVTDKDSWVGFFATKSLAGVQNSSIPEKLIVAYSSVEEHVKLAIIEVLGKLNNVDKSFLVERLADVNEDIRKEALNSLEKIDPELAVNMAQKIYEIDKSWLVRYKALEVILAKKPQGYKTMLKSFYDKEENRYIKEKIINTLGDSI